MTKFDLTRRTALSCLGASALGFTNWRSPAGAVTSEKILLIPRDPIWSEPDLMTIGIGESGHLLVSGGIPNLWMGREFLATAGVEAWRLPRAAEPGKVFAAGASMRGRPLALIVGDLADRRWLDIAWQIMVAARQAGRFVIAANTCHDATALSFGALADRLQSVCDCLVAATDLPVQIGENMDACDKAILVVSGIETITGVAARLGGCVFAARLPPGIYRHDSQRTQWMPGRSPMPRQLRSPCGAMPALLLWQIPFFLPKRFARAFHYARRSLPGLAGTLTSVSNSDANAWDGSGFTLTASWLTRLS